MAPHPGADALPPALVLAGGLGTRLQALFPDTPKAMVPIAGRPFLDYVLAYLRRSGVRSVVLCLGHAADTIMAHVEGRVAPGLAVCYAVESHPAGTGGAIKLGAAAAGPGPVFALNGDTFAEVDYPAMLAAHRAAGAPLTVALAAVPDAGRYGAVTLDASGTIRSFGEKRGQGPGLINAGVYLVERRVVDDIPAGTVSWEHDVLPRWVGRGARGYTMRGLFVDIGVPEDYRRLSSAPGDLPRVAGVT